VCSSDLSVVVNPLDEVVVLLVPLVVVFVEVVVEVVFVVDEVEVDLYTPISISPKIKQTVPINL
jgi:hypothetical protein